MARTWIHSGHPLQTGLSSRIAPFCFPAWHANCLSFGGRSNAMKNSTTDKVEGKAHEIKGAIKEKIGRATNNPDLETEGTAEKVGGKVQKKVGDVEKVFGK
jgi:uncharacterized protein YjbJ (UPF0337 family)